MCNVLPERLPGERMDPAPSFNWSHILGLKHAEIERECGRGPSSFKSSLFYRRNLIGIKSLELNPTDYQIKQLHNALTNVKIREGVTRAHEAS